MLKSKTSILIAISLTMSLDHRIYLSPSYNRSHLFISQPLVLSILHLLDNLLYIHHFIPKIMLKIVIITLHRILLSPISSNQIFSISIVIHKWLIDLNSLAVLISDEKRVNQWSVKHNKKWRSGEKTRILIFSNSFQRV